MLKLVVTCEHAAHEVPDGLELGIPPEVVTSHVGWDPGAHEVAEAVARRWSVPLLAGRYSRLVADLNRGPNNPEVVPEVAFGVPVPGNRNLGTKGRETRVRDYHTPYWRAARDAVDSALEIGPVLHLSVHSFSADFGGEARPWDFGVLHERDTGLEGEVARALLHGLGRGGGSAARNQPYGGVEDYLVTNFRRDFAPETYAGILLEVSQRNLDRLTDVKDLVVAAVASALRRAPQ